MISVAYAALWLFVLSVPWDGVIVIGGFGVLSKLTGALALGLTLLAAVVTGRVRRWHMFHVAALLFVVVAVFGLMVFHGGERLPKKLGTYVLLVLVLWIIWEVAPSRQRLIGLLTAYVFGAYVPALGTIMLYRKEPSELYRFAMGGVDANDLAMTLVLALPMAWYLGLTYRQPLLRWICRLYLPVGVIGIGLTGSRGGMITTVVALLVVPLSMTKLTAGRMATAIAMLGLCGALAVAYVPQKLVQRLSTTETEVEDLRFGGRFKLWVAGLEAFTARPVMGYGTAQFIGAITPKLGRMSQVAHNSYISVLVEQGLVGFILYMTMIITVWREVLTLPRPERRFALVLLASLALAMFPLTWEDRKPVWFILAALLGLSQARRTRTGGFAEQPRPGTAASITGPPRPVRPLQPQTAPRRNASA